MSHVLEAWRGWGRHVEIRNVPRQAMAVSKAGPSLCLGRARIFHRSEEWAMGTCRFTVGRETTPAEVQTVRGGVVVSTHSLSRRCASHASYREMTEPAARGLESTFVLRIA